MKRNISIIVLAGLLASCTSTSGQPIRSLTHSAAAVTVETEEEMYDALYGDLADDLYQQGYGREFDLKKPEENTPSVDTPNSVIPPVDPLIIQPMQPVMVQPMLPMQPVLAQPMTEPLIPAPVIAPDAEVLKPADPSIPPKVEPFVPGDITDSKFGAVGAYKIGNPYLIDGVSYYPHEDYNYSEIGMASWYGPNFHGGKTSNGETFNETAFTAAHRTLPMPSLVRVTNLENGAAITVKVNDRGPYARDRIIDLSSAAADVLGFKQKGTARVKVEILKEESMKLKELAMEGKNTDIYLPDIKMPVGAADLNQPTPELQPAPAPVALRPAFDPTVRAVDSIEETSGTSIGDYFVQVAALSTYDKAEQLKNKLVNIGPVKIFKSVVDGNTIYKVRLGEFVTKSEADVAQAEVVRSGISGSRVIVRENGGFKWQ